MTVLRRWLFRLVKAENHERRAVLVSFLYAFVLFCSYFMLRPLRDEMAIRVGVTDLNVLFWLTFVGMLLTVPLFGWVTSRYGRSRFIPYIYLFFIIQVLLFILLFRLDQWFQPGVAYARYLAMAFFVWVSIFNLFVVSVFWSFMSDIYSPDSARRLFAFIAAGGTTGTLFGSLLASIISTTVESNNSSAAISLLLILCIGLLLTAIGCAHWLHRWHVRHNGGSFESLPPPAAHTVWAAIPMVFRSGYLLGICLLVMLYSLLSTFLYFMQADIVKTYVANSEQRIALFASIDFLVNALTLLFQLAVTSRIVNRFGLAISLTLVPVILAVGFSMLALFSNHPYHQELNLVTLPWISGLQLAFLPVLLFGVQIIRRAGQYALNRPAREMLYTVVSRDEKYKAKNFIDTTVYRGSDAVSGQLYAELAVGMGLKLSVIAWIAVPVSIMWGMVSYALGRSHRRKARRQEKAAAYALDYVSE